MDNFKVIYKILKRLESMLDYDEMNYDELSHEALGITRERWERLLLMMQDDGYIKGISYTRALEDDRRRIVKPIRPEITIKGLEYLSENTTMKKVSNLAKGIVEIIP